METKWYDDRPVTFNARYSSGDLKYLSLSRIYFLGVFAAAIFFLNMAFYFFQHYKKSIIDSFDQHPNANFLLILEEDLDVSVDILSYFKQLLPVYENDETVYCISAWNDQVQI